MDRSFDELLALFTAWRQDIDKEPFAPTTLNQELVERTSLPPRSGAAANSI